MSQIFLHCSAILQPEKFGQYFKDMTYCAKCCLFYEGHKICHSCWVPLSLDFPDVFNQHAKNFQQLSEDLEKLNIDYTDNTKYNGQRLKAKRNFPARQMMEFNSYNSLMNKLQCLSSIRWSWVDNTVPTISTKFNLLKNHFLDAKELPLSSGQLKDYFK